MDSHALVGLELCVAVFFENAKCVKPQKTDLYDFSDQGVKAVGCYCWGMTPHELNEELRDAVADASLLKIQQCLQAGADIHQVRCMDQDHGSLQPVTVLRMVQFRVSDSMMECTDWLKLKEITAMLPGHGADTAYSLAFAQDRYVSYGENLHDEASREDAGLGPHCPSARHHGIFAVTMPALWTDPTPP